MKSITSRHNPLVQRIRDAVREHSDEIVIEGPKPVADALTAGWRPLVLACSEGREQELPQVPGRAEVVSLSAAVFKAISTTQTPQGVVGLFERPAASAASVLARRDSVAVALDAVQDPGNVGTIVRLAAAFDASGVLLLPGCADPLGPKAIRASAGAVLHVPCARVTPEELVESGLELVAADAGGEAVDPPSRAAILVFGNEGSGPSQAILNAARLIAVPISARVESLNVAASAAILLARSFALRG